MANTLIRNAAAKHHVRLWEIAALEGYSDSHWSRKLRNELPLEEQKRIVDSIVAFANRRDGEDGENIDA